MTGSKLKRGKAATNKTGKAGTPSGSPAEKKKRTAKPKILTGSNLKRGKAATSKTGKAGTPSGSPAAKRKKTAKFPLSKLPPSFLVDVIRLLDWPDRQSLRNTNNQFYLLDEEVGGRCFDEVSFHVGLPRAADRFRCRFVRAYDAAVQELTAPSSTALLFDYCMGIMKEARIDHLKISLSQPNRFALDCVKDLFQKCSYRRLRVSVENIDEQTLAVIKSLISSGGVHDDIRLELVSSSPAMMPKLREELRTIRAGSSVTIVWDHRRTRMAPVDSAIIKSLIKQQTPELRIGLLQGLSAREILHIVQFWGWYESTREMTFYTKESVVEAARALAAADADFVCTGTDLMRHVPSRSCVHLSRAPGFIPMRARFFSYGINIFPYNDAHSWWQWKILYD